MKLKINRRGLLKSLSLILGGSFISSCASRRNVSKNCVDFHSCKFNKEWLRLQGNDAKGYYEFIGSLNLKYITPEMVIKTHIRKKGRVWNSLPPKSLWKNIAPTLRAVDRVCGDTGVRVKEIVSLYRSPEYNARCNGAKPNSWHKENVAMDVIMSNSSPRRTYNLFKKFRESGLFNGGVGSYTGFTHIDTRGYEATW